MNLSWNYNKGYVDVSMPGYVENQLKKYNHKPPTKPQDSPFPAPPIRYGKAAQTITEPDPTPALSTESKKYVQQVTGSFLFYGRAVDPTILMALNAIARQQSKPTERTMEQVKHFLDYMATHSDATIRYY